MDKKEFLNLTAKLLQEYGFLKIGNEFFLNLERVIVRLYRHGDRFAPGDYCYGYNVCFKDIHEDYKFETKEDYKNMPEDLGILRYIDLYKQETKNTDKLNIYVRGYTPSVYTQDEWTKLFVEAIHKEFDPFKTDFEKYILKFTPKNHGMSIDAYKEFIQRGIVFN